MLKIAFSPTAWNGYLSFKSDKKLSNKIDLLLSDIARNPTSGLGKPEKLKGDLSGCYSRRIDSQHRLIYRIKEDFCEVVQVGGHYKDK